MGPGIGRNLRGGLLRIAWVGSGEIAGKRFHSVDFCDTVTDPENRSFEAKDLPTSFSDTFQKR